MFLAMLSRGMHRSIAEELFFPFFFYLSFSLSHVCASSEVHSPLRGKKMDLVVFPHRLPHLCMYRVYIHNVYKHESSIYIIHIYLSIPYKCISSRWLACPLSLFIYAYLLSRPYLFLFFPENITKIYT